ncbi:EAL domain-containing protein [Salinarimonas sp.]|uniref:bifunctional diguanylate cyclase/phosphodiesterase n=1 Tax=Salinarimonas sp. TaxID=2766526 RepID=UPI003918DB17
MAAQICAAPIAVVNFIDRQRQWFKAEVGLGIRETDLDISICKHALLEQSLFVVPDTRSDPRFAANPLVLGAAGLRFYGGALLKTQAGLPLGTICVLDREPRPDGLSDDQQRALLALARAVMRELDLRLVAHLFWTSLDAVETGFLMLDPDRNLQIVNREAASLLGLQEMKTASTAPLLSPLQTAPAKSELRRLLELIPASASDVTLEHTTDEGRTLAVRAFRTDDGSAVVTINDVSTRRAAEAAARYRESHYTTLTDAIPQKVWIADRRGMTTYCNRAMLEYCGSVGDTVDDRFGLFHPEDRRAALATRQMALDTSAPQELEARFRGRDGTYRWHSVTLAPVLHDATIISWIGVALDVHDVREAAREARENEALLQLTLENMDQGLLMVDAQEMVRVYNKRFVDLLELPEDLVARRPHFSILADYQERTGEVDTGEENAPEWLVKRRSVIGAPPIYERERPNGTVVEVRTVHLAEGGAIRTYADVTTRAKAERELNRLARHDPLTGLPNRRAFQEKLEELAVGTSAGRRFALLLLDLDSFKDVNDTLGHPIGDWLLANVAKRLCAGLAASAIAARLGGDEFAILLPEVRGEWEAQVVARQVMATLKEPLIHQGRDLGRRTSIGIALGPDHGRTAAELTRSADLALYAAKREGRNRAVMFAPALAKAAQERVRVLREAQRALDEDRILPFYQPKIDLWSGQIYGFEALLRWVHPSGGTRAPGELAPAFENAEISVALGQRMLQRVLADMVSWQRDGLPFGSVAINVSNAEFANPRHAETVISMLSERGLPASCLEIELTESVLLGSNSTQAAEAMDRFRRAGIAVALDDFGTGFASLTHLNQFPLDWIKIDRSFIEAIAPENERAGAIAEGIVRLARSLKIGVVAEGVETRYQSDFLRERNCGLGQGYLFSRPMNGTRVPHFVSGWNSRDFIGSDGVRQRA